MLQEDLYIPKRGIMTAICRPNKDMNDILYHISWLGQHIEWTTL